MGWEVERSCIKTFNIPVDISYVQIYVEWNDQFQCRKTGWICVVVFNWAALLLFFSSRGHSWLIEACPWWFKQKQIEMNSCHGELNIAVSQRTTDGPDFLRESVTCISCIKPHLNLQTGDFLSFCDINVDARPRFFGITNLILFIFLICPELILGHHISNTTFTDNVKKKKTFVWQ